MLVKNKLILLILSIIFTLMCNSSLIEQHMSVLQAEFPTIERSIEYLLAIAAIFLVFVALSIYRPLLLAGTVMIFAASSTLSYCIYAYNIKINHKIIHSIMRTNTQEILEFINIKLALWVVFCVVTAVLIARKFTFSQDIRKMQFLGIIFILMLIVSQDPTKVKTHYAPFNLLSLLSQSLSSKEKFPDTLPFTQNAFTLTGKQAGNLNVVLVIGESARADHFHLNGYARDTTPNLDKRANLVSFKDVTSCGNVTMDSVPCMLIRVGKADFNQQQRHQSFITVLKQLGFDTIWLANQGSFALLDDYINNIAGEAELVLMPGRDLLLANKLDENILPYLDDYLNKHLGNNLIIIHSQGSHHSYDARYSEPFRMFTPTAGNNIFKNNLKKIARENIINSYDNSILYTDYFLNEVIKRFDHKNALFIYVSDHGESLGENGNYLHGYDESPAQYHVPMIMWLSDLFISDHPGVLTKLRQKLEAKLSHDNLFHTVLDCAGVESQLVNKTLSLCQ